MDIVIGEQYAVRKDRTGHLIQTPVVLECIGANRPMDSWRPPTAYMFALPESATGGAGIWAAVEDVFPIDILDRLVEEYDAHMARITGRG